MDLYLTRIRLLLSPLNSLDNSTTHGGLPDNQASTYAGIPTIDYPMAS